MTVEDNQTFEWDIKKTQEENAIAFIHQVVGPFILEHYTPASVNHFQHHISTLQLISNLNEHFPGVFEHANLIVQFLRQQHFLYIEIVPFHFEWVFNRR